MCVTKGGVVLDDKFCNYHLKPVAEETCDEDNLPACEVQWYAEQWSEVNEIYCDKISQVRS